MKIQSRIWISHIVLLLTPIITICIALLLFLGSIFYFVRSGNHIHAEEYAHFQQLTIVSHLFADKMLEWDVSPHYFDYVYSILDPNQNYIRLIKDNQITYTYGDVDLLKRLPSDINTEPSNVPTGFARNNIYFESMPHEFNKSHYNLTMIAVKPLAKSNNPLLKALGDLIIFFAIALLLIIFFTSRFITKFLLSHIMTPLNELRRGAKEMEHGNLDIHLRHDLKDEFQPILIQFNNLSIALSKSLKEREFQEKNRKAMIAGLSHDIRSPLTSIQAYVEGLRDGIANTPEKQAKYLDIIHRKVNDVEGLLNQLFFFSKIDAASEHDQLYKDKIELNAFTNQYLNDNYEIFKNKGLALSFSSDLDKATIISDRSVLQRIYQNLIDNSLKYKTEKNAYCKIHLSSQENTFKLTFTDNGPGVSPEALPHLFESFYRTDNARTNPKDSAGLGLAIIQRAITLMGGNVSASNTDPHGLCITILIPRKEITKND